MLLCVSEERKCAGPARGAEGVPPPRVPEVPGAVVASSVINPGTGPPSALTNPFAECCAISITAVSVVVFQLMPF